MKMPFGKFRGYEIADLPDEYLEWLFSVDLREPLRAAIEHEITVRQEPSGTVRQTADEIITSGYRALALKFHPDRGGDTAAMQVVNQAASWLRGQLRGLQQ